MDSLVTDQAEPPDWVPRETGLVGESLRNGEVVVSGDVRVDPRIAYPALASTIGRSLACIPVGAGDNAGVLILGHPEVGHFGSALDELARKAAESAPELGFWSLGERSPIRRLFSIAREVLDSERRQREINGELHAVAQQITSAETLDDALAAVVTSVTRVFGAASASIYLVDENGHIAPRRYTTRHTGEAHWDSHVRVRPNGVTMTVLRNGQSVWIDDRATDPRTSDLNRGEHGSVAALPLRHGAGQIGVLYVNWSEHRDLSRSDLGLLETLAAYGAIAIDGARLREHERLSRQQAETEHERLQAFLNAVAHDLRGPLTLLVAYSELLRQGSLADRYETTQQALPALESAAHRVQRLVHDLIDLARINAGEFEVQPSSVDLGDVAREVVAQLQPTTDVHTIEFRGLDHLVGEWDPARVRDMLTHLVRNAIHYAPDGGLVGIEISCDDDEALICVSDAGLGIAPEQRERIFLPFSRVDDLPTTKERGLGLYLAKAIVDAHQGRIWVDSEVGCGSTFYVALPLRRPAAASA